MQVGILGAGAFGTAVAKVLAEKGIHVRLWSHSESCCHDINRHHENRRWLPGLLLPETVTSVQDLPSVVKDSEALIIAVPSLFVLGIVKKLAISPGILEARIPIAVLTKGLIKERDEEPRLVVSAIEDYLPGVYKGALVYISGPSQAEELAAGKITGLISASLNPKNAIFFRALLSTETLKLFSSLDIIGVQVCAAIKNVMAIAFGVADAMRGISGTVGDNTESLLLAACLNEIRTIGAVMGSTHPETFSSIAGVGDLDVTCRSPLGRNRRLGREIVMKEILSRFTDIDDLIERIGELGYLPEGVITAKLIHEFALLRKLKLPIAQTVFRLLNKERKSQEAICHILALV